MSICKMAIAIFLMPCLLFANPWEKYSGKTGFKRLEITKKPYWKKPRVVKKLKKRELVVSVRTDEREEGKKEIEQLFMSGAGYVESEFAPAKEKMLRFEELKKLAPDQFKEVKYTPKNEQLFIHGVAMGWHAKMVMRLLKESVSKGLFRLHFHVTHGSFQGMTGYIQLEELLEDSKRRRTEFSMTAFYESEKLPLPSILLKFGLEFVMEAVASRMRRYIEEGGEEDESGEAAVSTSER